MSLDKMPDAFLDQVEEDPETGCWVWFKDPNPASKVPSPVFSRRAAWRYAYELLHGPIPRGGRFPVIAGCIGSQCVNPDHRLGTPQDQKNVRHQCPVCEHWHGENSPRTVPQQVLTETPEDPHWLRVPPVVEEGPFRVRELTPEQEEIERIFE